MAWNIRIQKMHFFFVFLLLVLFALCHNTEARKKMGRHSLRSKKLYKRLKPYPHSRRRPSQYPSSKPSSKPFSNPSHYPTTTYPPSARPTRSSSIERNQNPTPKKLSPVPKVVTKRKPPLAKPTRSPSIEPSQKPIIIQKKSPTVPSEHPSTSFPPTRLPTVLPSSAPTSAPSKLVDVILPTVRVIFELDPGSSLDEAMIQQLFTDFMLDLLEETKGDVTPQTEIYYSAEKGEGQAVTTGNWSGEIVNVPTENWLLQVFSFLGVGDLYGALRDAGYDPNVLIVQVNGITVQPSKGSFQQRDSGSGSTANGIRSILTSSLILAGVGFSLLVALLFLFFFPPYSCQPQDAVCQSRPYQALAPPVPWILRHSGNHSFSATCRYEHRVCGLCKAFCIFCGYGFFAGRPVLRM